MCPAATYYQHDRKEMLKFLPVNVHFCLDVGCGEGAFGRMVKCKTGSQIWGIEPNQKACAKACQHLDRIFCETFEEFIMPETYEERFDCIFFNDVLEHLYDPWAALKKAKGLLSNEGVVVASIPNVLFADHLYELIFQKDWKYRESGILDLTHIRFFTPRSIVRMFKTSGFLVKNMTGINPTPSRKLKLLGYLFPSVFQELRFPQYAVVARKAP